MHRCLRWSAPLLAHGIVRSRADFGPSQSTAGHSQTAEAAASALLRQATRALYARRGRVPDPTPRGQVASALAAERPNRVKQEDPDSTAMSPRYLAREAANRRI